MTSRTVSLPVFWFLYMAALGVFFPYYGLYLEERGLTPAQVGVVLAMVPLAALLAQPFWGQLADRTGSRRAVLVILALGAALAFLVLGRLHGVVALALGTLLLASFHTVVLPMATAVTLAVVGAERFGLVRLWGTVGFLVLVWSFPRLPTLAGDSTLGRMFPLVAGLSLLAAVAGLRLPSSQALSARASRRDGLQLLRHRPLLRLLVVVFAAHGFIQGPIFLFPLYVSSRGGDAATVGHLWLAMLALEIPLIALSGRGLRRFGPRGLLRFGLLTEGVRWTASALVTDLGWLAAVHLLHGAGVAGVLVGAPLYLEKAVPERLRATGQALVAMAFGAGSVLSNLIVGVLIQRYGVDLPYAACGLGALVLALVLKRWLPPPRPPEAPVPSPAAA